MVTLLSIVVYILIILLVAAFVLACFVKDPRLEAVLSPRCAGRAWRRMFPTASKNEIRRFLEIVADSFLISKRDRLRLKPELGVMELYHALYPPRRLAILNADTMELETFVEELKCEYEFDLSIIWRDDMSFGDVFARATVGI